MKEPTPRGALAVVLVVLAVAGVAVAAWALGGGAIDAAMPAAAEAPSAKVEVAEGGTTSEPTAPAPQPFEDGARRDAAPRTAGPGEFLVRGRCIAEDGVPIADCSAVLIRGIARTEAGNAWRAQHPGTEPPAPALAHTSGDGTFAIAMEANPAFAVFFRAVRSDLVPAHAELATPPAGAEIDLGDVVLWRGVKVVGTVRFDDGKPCANTRVVMQNHAPEHAISRSSIRPLPHTWVSASTDEHGAFEFTDLLRHSTWQLDATEAGPHPRPLVVQLQASRPVETVSVVVEAPQTHRAITGRVLDEGGTAVANAVVGAVAEKGLPAVPSVRSAADGTYVLLPLRTTPASPARLIASTRNKQSEKDPQPVAWGSSGIDLVLRAMPSTSLRVTDEKGQPIADYRVQLDVLAPGQRTWGSPSYMSRFGPTGPFVDGICELGRLPARPTTIRVDFPAEAVRAPRFVDFDVQDGVMQQVDAVAPRGADLELRVVDGNGTAIVGTRLQLCDQRGDALEPEALADPSARSLWSAPARVPRALVLCEATTDAEGLARVLVPTATIVGVVALGPGHRASVHSLGLVAPGTSTTLVVRRGASLTGRVGPKQVLDWARGFANVAPFAEWHESERPRIVLQSVGIAPGTLPGRWTEVVGASVQPDGSFAAEGLEPGTFDAWFLTPPHVGVSGHQGLSHLLGPVTLAEGAETRLDREIDTVLPASGTFRLLCNGTPLANVTIVVRTDPPTRARTDAAGRFSVTAAPGHHSVVIASDPEGRPVQLLSETSLVLPGRDADAVLDVVCRAAKVELTVLDAAGLPVTGLPVRARPDRDPTHSAYLGITDQNGRASQWLGLGVHELEVRIVREPTEAEVEAELRTIEERAKANPAQGLPSTSRADLVRGARAFAKARLHESTPWQPLGLLVVESEAAVSIERRLTAR